MTGQAIPDWKRPWPQLILEARTPWQYWQSKIRPPVTDDWPRGHGQGVLVIPGFGQDASTTAALRSILEQQGFVSRDWGEGRNMGNRKGLFTRLGERLDELQHETSQKPAMVGWSLGGIIARELARGRPDSLERLITLGSPIGGPQATTISPLFRLLNPGAPPDRHDPVRYQPPALPCTAIYSRSDGIVHWRASQEPETSNTENIEVSGAHMALGFNPKVWYAICHRLSPDTRQQPFSWPTAQKRK